MSADQKRNDPNSSGFFWFCFFAFQGDQGPVGATGPRGSPGVGITGPKVKQMEKDHEEE